MVSTGFNGGYVANPRLAKVVQGPRCRMTAALGDSLIFPPISRFLVRICQV
jgi:hypothetical protein